MKKEKRQAQPGLARPGQARPGLGVVKQEPEASLSNGKVLAKRPSETLTLNKTQNVGLLFLRTQGRNARENLAVGLPLPSSLPDSVHCGKGKFHPTPTHSELVHLLSAGILQELRGTWTHRHGWVEEVEAQWLCNLESAMLNLPQLGLT